MEASISRKQDDKNRRIIECITTNWKRRYFLETGTPSERQLAADQIRYLMARLFVVGCLVWAGIAINLIHGSWSERLDSAVGLLLSMFAGYELKRYRDLRPTAKKRVQALAAINTSCEKAR